MRRVALGSALAAALAGASCGGGQTRGTAFDEAWHDEDGTVLTGFQKTNGPFTVPPGVDVAVGLVAGRTIIGAPLDGGSRWRYTHALDGRPAVAGTVVVGKGAGEVFALDARTGAVLWKRAAGGLLRGAGDDGQTTVVSLMSTTGLGSVVLAVARDGVVLRQIEDQAAIGVPAIVDRFAFLPWRGRYITVYDLGSGEETARITLAHPTSRAFALGGALFFGEEAVTRFDERIHLAPRGNASTVTVNGAKLPSAPRWLGSGDEVLPTRAVSADEVRLYARPNARGPMGLDGGRAALAYRRLVTGLEAETGKVAWVHVAEEEILGGAAYEGGFALCGAKGTVTFLDAAKGAPAGELSLGHPVDACIVQADRLRKKIVGGPSSLVESLTRALELASPELVPMQVHLLDTAARLEDDVITDLIISLAGGERGSSLLVDEARRVLAERRTGAGRMIAALNQPYDFLGGVLKSPPVGPLADALLAMRERQVAPVLARYLEDPACSADDVERAAAAVAELAGPAELPALLSFFAHYRGYDGEGESVARAVVHVARALVRLGQGAVVERAASDRFTSPAIKDKLAELSRPPRVAL
ncbi:PQQ-binding-like beta-propeller repeat protein [Polyangium aurulentum]|uniref:outer membrane protein assembly factor BamB family protein n=1 Tax=Polyangium aurulentum TaxID=2567896 RepID=UPI0010AE105C|nr:PQQ-binding-like beta-propeller repeat protein [Polyangium aurulentum]UQA61041.1 PQQ-binding-like beta-propeller repeat protein [Polyangium aurulentum]